MENSYDVEATISCFYAFKPSVAGALAQLVPGTAECVQFLPLLVSAVCVLTSLLAPAFSVFRCSQAPSDTTENRAEHVHRSQERKHKLQNWESCRAKEDRKIMKPKHEAAESHPRNRAGFS